MPSFVPITEEPALEELLSRPTRALVEAMRVLDGDILILGASGKMGPTLARLAKRASGEAGTRRRVIASARFSDAALPAQLERHGIDTLPCDLFDPAQIARLPDAPNVIYMVGQKFGTLGQEARTWAVNAYLPGVVGERFRRSRIVAFSTGNVYPLTALNGDGPTEDSATGPIGEYAQSALARERILTYCSLRHDTPMAILRLNYAVEPRYGVFRDIADRVWCGDPVDLSMSKVNVIWQRDANAIALMGLPACMTPPVVLNVTGRAVAVRQIAELFGERWKKPVSFTGKPAETALLSNPSRMFALFGEPEVTFAEMIARVADWVESGGASLGKKTHFEQREGTF